MGTNTMYVHRMGHSIISGVSACFTYSNPDAIFHICSSKDECYLNQFLC